MEGEISIENSHFEDLLPRPDEKYMCSIPKYINTSASVPTVLPQKLTVRRPQPKINSQKATDDGTSKNKRKICERQVPTIGKQSIGVHPREKSVAFASFVPLSQGASSTSQVMSRYNVHLPPSCYPIQPSQGLQSHVQIKAPLVPPANFQAPQVSNTYVPFLHKSERNYVILTNLSAAVSVSSKKSGVASSKKNK